VLPAGGPYSNCTAVTLLIDFDRYWTGANDEFSDRGGVEDVLFLRDHIGFLDGCNSVVDLGCGVGNLVAHFRGRGVAAEGLTYQSAEVEAAKRKHGIDLHLGDLHALPWRDHTFAGAICWDALEHTLAPLIALMEMRRVLEPDGRALIFIPGQPWQQERYHVIVPTIAQMKHLLELAGFARFEFVDYSDYVNEYGRQDQMAVYRTIA